MDVSAGEVWSGSQDAICPGFFMLLGWKISLSSVCCYMEWYGSVAFQICLGKGICKVSLEGKGKRVHIKSGCFKVGHSWYLIPWRNSWGHLDERILEVVSLGHPGVWISSPLRGQEGLSITVHVPEYNFSLLLPLLFLSFPFSPSTFFFFSECLCQEVALCPERECWDAVCQFA